MMGVVGWVEIGEPMMVVRLYGGALGRKRHTMILHDWV